MTGKLRKQIAQLANEQWEKSIALDGSVSEDQYRFTKKLAEMGFSVSVDLAARPMPSPPAAAKPQPTASPKPSPRATEHARDRADKARAHGYRTLRLEDNAWGTLPQERVDVLCRQIHPIDGKYEVDPASAEIKECDLSWYSNHRLLRVANTSWEHPRLKVYYLENTIDGSLYRLNGTSPAIHEVNAKDPLKLAPENVLSYLYFFCFFVRGEEGPFYILESLEQPEVKQLFDTRFPPKEVIAIFEGTARASSYNGLNEMGHHRCSCVIFYSNAIFIAEFAVHPTGMVEMLEDEPIAADLPIRIDEPLR